MGHGVKPAVPTPEKINKGKTEDKMNYKEITYKDIKKNEAINTYIKKAINVFFNLGNILEYK